MFEKQYHAYERKFGRNINIWPTVNGSRGIGGKNTVVGEIIIQIPFGNLNIIIDVDFLIIGCDAPSLLSNRKMIRNGLDISLQGRYLYIERLL